MARINLLPWREEQRRERQRQFMSSFADDGHFGCCPGVLAGFIFDQKISSISNPEMKWFREKSRQLEVRIKRIEELERTRARLISRKQVIERLQASRSMTVELLDNLAKTIPVGVTLTTVHATG